MHIVYIGRIAYSGLHETLNIKLYIYNQVSLEHSLGTCGKDRLGWALIHRPLSG